MCSAGAGISPDARRRIGPSITTYCWIPMRRSSSTAGRERRDDRAVGSKRSARNRNPSAACGAERGKAGVVVHNAKHIPICMETFPVGNAAQATRAVALGTGPSTSGRTDIAPSPRRSVGPQYGTHPTTAPVCQRYLPGTLPAPALPRPPATGKPRIQWTGHHGKAWRSCEPWWSDAGGRLAPPARAARERAGAGAGGRAAARLSHEARTALGGKRRDVASATARPYVLNRSPR